MNQTLQNILILLGIIAISGIGFYLYTQRDGISLQNATVNNQVEAETADFLQRLNELKDISLEGAIFNDPRFTSLVGYSAPVIPSPVGKPNPFAVN